jgi:hypothetical protein
MDYGPPNFGEDPVHDAKETYWRLDLKEPICVKGDDPKADTPDIEAASGVRHLQIVYLNGYPKGGGWVGRRVIVTGTLSHAITGHHHTTVLITAERTDRAP